MKTKQVLYVSMSETSENIQKAYNLGYDVVFIPNMVEIVDVPDFEILPLRLVKGE